MFTKIEQTRIFVEILKQLKQEISAGNLKAGDKLPPERTLSEALGVSRAAVREAIRALEVLGLVSCVQGGGNYLAEDISGSMVEPMGFIYALSGNDIIAAQELREALEIKTAGLAARRCTAADACRLEKILADLSNAKTEVERAQADWSIHYAIADISGNSLISSTLNAASGLVDSIIKGIRISIMAEPERVEEIDAQHRAIVAAIAANREKEAMREMEAHMELVSRYVKVLRESL